MLLTHTATKLYLLSYLKRDTADYLKHHTYKRPTDGYTNFEADNR